MNRTDQTFILAKLATMDIVDVYWFKGRLILVNDYDRDGVEIVSQACATPFRFQVGDSMADQELAY